MNRLYESFVNIPTTICMLAVFFGFGFASFIYHMVRNGKEFSVSGLIRHCVPFDVLRSKSFHMDIKALLIEKFTGFIIRAPGVAVIAIVASFASQWLADMFPYHLAPRPGYVAIFSCTLILLLASEFAGYVIHYAEHKIPVLWELHKVHHSAEDLNPLSGHRGHTIPIVYSGIITGMLTGTIAGLYMFLFKMSLVELVALSVIAGKIGNVFSLHWLKHSHFPVSLGWLDRIFISPHMHQVHHSKIKQHHDKNFGVNLSIFDWLFNTGYKPKKNEEIILGLDGYTTEELQQYHTLFGAYVTPLLKIRRRLAKAIGRDDVLVDRTATAAGSKPHTASM